MSNRTTKKNPRPSRSAPPSARAGTAPAGRPTPTAPHQAPPRNSRRMLIGVLVAAALVIAVVLATTGRSDGPQAADSQTPGSSATTPGGPSVTASPEEQKYIGRLLPAGYQEPQTQPVSYSGVTKMTDIAADTSGSAVSVALGDVTAGKIVAFSYTKASGESIPLMAYVKPSGAVFVGVSYCIPCKGDRQFIDADGTLTCGSCRTKRDLTTMVGLSGACRLYPLDELPATVSGDRLLVDKAAIDQWTAQPIDRPVG